jgi:hypothetical protein
MMKRLIKLIGSLSVWELCGRFPVTAGVMTLLGVGGGIVAGILTPPSITPLPSAAFSQSQTIAKISNNVLKPNAGTAGSENFPSTPTASFFINVEGSVDPAFVGSNFEYALGSSGGGQGLLLNGGGPGAPVFLTQKNVLYGGQWWLAISPFQYGIAPSVGSSPTKYLNGYLPWTASGGGCAREPSGIVGPNNAGATSRVNGLGAAAADFGFQCATNPTVQAMNTMPNIGAQQPASGVSCSSNSPASGEMTVTAAVPIAHGLAPGQTYSLQGFTPSGYNATYTAIAGTTGTTLVGSTTTGGGTCPGAVSVYGTALSGTGGAINLTAISTTNPFGTNQTTGITTKPGAKFCGVIGEYGSDSPTPGFQFAAFSDWNGTALTNSPAVSTWPNQGAANFTGYTTTITQNSTNGGALNVTAMNSYAISAATWNNSTSVSFTFSSNPNLWLGSEFTVSGSNPAGYNGTYIVAAGTTPNTTTVTATPLAGSLQNVQALANPGSYVSGASAVGVIVPGMTVFGSTGTLTYVLPYGTFGTSGAGGVGQYALNANQIATATFTASISGTTMTVTGTPGLSLAIGEGFSGAGVTAGTIITAYGTGTGGAGTYTVNNSQTVSSETMTAAGTLGSSGAPVSLFAWSPFYQTGAATASSSTTIGVLTNRTQASIGDYFAYIGGYNTLIPTQFSGWGGALANVGDFWGIFPESSNAPSQTALASLCQKTTDYQSFATANSLTVNSLYRLNDTGIWADSSVAQFTGSISGTALTISSTQTGSTSALPAGTVIAGAGIAGCPAACPTISSGSGSSYVLSASGGTVASEGMTAGKWKPAMPVASNGFNGYVDSAGLHVTSIASANKAVFTATTVYPTNSFIGHIDNGTTTGTTGNVLTVTTAPTNPPGTTTVTPGTQVCWTGAPSPCPFIISNGTGAGGTGTYFLDQSISGGVPASTTFTGTVTSTTGGESSILLPTNLVVSAISSGTLINGMLVTDNNAHITGQPLLINAQQTGTTGSTGTYTLSPHYYPVIGTGETMYGVSTQLAPGQYVRDDATHTVTTPIKIIGYGTGANAPGLCSTGEWGCGTYTILNPGALVIGSSGSPVAFTASGTTDGQAIAPGPALTIKDQGPGVTFPVTNYGTGTGSLYLSGTYNTGSLGGTPSAIQAQVSYTAGGPPIAGCSACAWTNLANAALSGGNWSGQALNIPAGGPYFVSVRAANGAAYATLQSTIKVGLVFDVWGVGQSQPLLTPSNGGWAFSTYPGLWGVNTPTVSTFYYYDTGPSVSGPNLFPSYAQLIGGDQLAISGGGLYLAEGARDFGANLQTAMGYPVTVSNWTRDGAGIGMFSWGGTTQSQTVGLGDGSTTTWCSATAFCANVGQGGTLDWNLASLTGSLFTASISGTTLTVSGITTGALMPGEVLSDSFTGGGGHITGSPTLVNCTANCGGLGGATSVWTISVNEGTVASESMRADPSGGAPAPFYNPQASGLPLVTQKGDQVIKAGTFSVSVNGTVVCTDSNTFPAYNLMAGNCTGAGISSSFVNYVTGDYQIAFSSAPANGAVITASWVENVSTDDPLLNNVISNLDFVGTGSDTSGFLSSIYSRTPGGSSGHIVAGCVDNVPMWETGYPTGSVGVTQMLDWFLGVKIPGIFTGTGSTPYMSPSTPLVIACDWRGDGLPSYQLVTSEMAYNSMADQWSIDLATKSTFTGTIASNVLTLTAAATGPMWEGEIVGCATFSLTCPVTSGTYITSLASGTWGANGSTYNLGGSPANIASATAMANAVYYSQGTPIYAGGDNDGGVGLSLSGVNGTDGFSPHPTWGLAGAPRVARKWSAEIYGVLTGNASPPTLDRVKADAGGCDTSALAGPCFDVGNTYAASATPTSVAGAVMTFNGLAANARPIVVGQAVSCSGCAAGLVVTSVSNPPTQSTAAGKGQIGAANNGFTVTTNASSGWTTGAVTFGCSGTAGTGSNCIDVAFSINTPGTYGTAAALATCGDANNLNGTAPPYTDPNGYCSSNGVGSLVHNFRIGTQQNAWGGATPSQLGSPGSVYDDGVDPFGSGGATFNQSAAFTCNIVAAKVVQCVKGAAYSSGVVSGVGQWASGSTYIEYGDTVVGTGRGNSLVGNVGGQPFAFTAGSGYTPGTYTISASNCVMSTGAPLLPAVDVTVGSGGGIVDVYGSAAANSKAIGEAVGNGCQFNLNASVTATISNASGVTAKLNVTGWTSGGLATGMTISGSGVVNSPVLTTCASGCAGNPLVSPFIPVNTTAQVWNVTCTTSCSNEATSETMTAAFASMGAGTGGAIATPPNKPTDGTYGITDSGYSAILMGDELYDNSGFVGNPLHSFFDNGMGGYFEPGLPVRPFGLFLGAAVSG